jgi:hypothetical protein
MDSNEKQMWTVVALLIFLSLFLGGYLFFGPRPCQ